MGTGLERCYVRVVDSLPAFEQSSRQFVEFGHRSWSADWSVEREIAPEKVRDTHKLVCLGLPEDKIHLWPCPDPTKCKLDRCPESLVVNVVHV